MYAGAKKICLEEYIYIYVSVFVSVSVSVSVFVSVSVYTCLYPSDNRLCGVCVCVRVCVLHAEKAEIGGGSETRDTKERDRECHAFFFFSRMSRIGNAKDNNRDSQRERNTLVCVCVDVAVCVCVGVCVVIRRKREEHTHKYE